MERLSAWMDGELEQPEAGATLARLKERPELQALWETYHVIGDAMRGDRLLSRQFGAGLAQRLAEEPTVLAPQRRRARRVATYGLSAAASAAAVAMVAWVALSTGSVTAPAGPQVASAPVAEASRRVNVQPVASTAMVAATPKNAVAPEVVSLPRDGRMNEYFLAHQGFSPSTAIQGVTPYIRSVSVNLSSGTR